MSWGPELPMKQWSWTTILSREKFEVPRQANENELPIPHRRQKLFQRAEF
jgi:hypothetical protein